MPAFNDITGKVFGRITVIGGPIKTLDGRTRIKVMCRCKCGTEWLVRRSHLLENRTKSCGCFNIEFISSLNRTHGMSKTLIYGAYRSMISRCTNKNDIGFKRYGGRGITVCKRWMNSFDNFLFDMGKRPKGMTLDRKDNNGAYSPENCQWVTPRKQANNTRRNIFLEFNGERMTLSEWSTKTGILGTTIRRRINTGWSIRDALMIPAGFKTTRSTKP